LKKFITMILSITLILCLSFNAATFTVSAKSVESDLFLNDTTRDITIAVTWEKNDASFVFIDPSGAVIDPKIATKEVSSIVSDSGMNVLIKGAAKGQWKWKYDKGSNTSLNVSVSDYKEPVWIQSFKITSVEAEMLSFEFETYHPEDKNYNYTISLKTSKEADSSKEVYTGSATANSVVTGSINLNDINTYDSYILVLQVTYNEADSEYFDVAYSDPFEFTNPNEKEGISDYNVIIDQINGSVSIDWSEYIGDSADKVMVKIYADDQIILENAFGTNEMDTCIGYYDLSAKELKTSVVLIDDGLLSLENVKTIAISPTDKEFYIELPEYNVTNQSIFPVKYYNADNQEVSVVLNEIENTWTLNKKGEKLIDLKEDYSEILIQYTDANNVTRKYDTTVSIDIYPPTLNIYENLDGMVTSKDSVIITGKTEVGSNLSINGNTVELKEEGAFLYTLPLQGSNNLITILSTDTYGNTTSYYANVTKDSVIASSGNFFKEYLPLIITFALSLAGTGLIIFICVKKKKSQKISKKDSQKMKEIDSQKMKETDTQKMKEIGGIPDEKE